MIDYKLPFTHNGFLVWEHTHGTTDLINPINGAWATFPTKRFAKWSATFMHNMNKKFKTNTPTAHEYAQLNQQPTVPFLL
jgi:hypothetical protein